MPKSREVEIPPHVHAAVDFAFGLHSSKFRAKKGFDRRTPVIRFKLHNPMDTKDFPMWALPLNAHRELKVQRIAQNAMKSRSHFFIRLPVESRQALNAAWKAKGQSE